MTRTTPEEVTGARWPVVGLAGASGITAVAGGLDLVVGPMGRQSAMLPLLEHTPFETFLVPGLLLTIVVGGTSLASALLTWRRSVHAAGATILAGGALTVWIVAEVGMMRELAWLHVVCGTLGLTILALGIRAGWRTRHSIHRWIIVVTGAEAIGFMIPAAAGILSTKWGVDGIARVALLGAAGFLEGAALGLGQAITFPLPVRRLRFVLLTASGAAIVWVCVMTLTTIVGAGAWPTGLVVALAIIIGLFALLAIGSLQWLELRWRTDDAWRWIGWTALAWTLALPLSFAPAPFVDESTPLGSHFLLWGSGGVLMAHVMALITWQGARRLR